MRWHRLRVEGRLAGYGEAHPDGEPLSTVVFLHGWALSDRTYRRSLDLLAERGHRVLAPALPGFRATAELPPEQFSLTGYGDWVASFVDAVGVSEPVTLVGHSFGGAVAIKCTHGHPDLVKSLVLVNSIGGAAWSAGGRPRAMNERPLGDWGVHLATELASVRGVTKVLPVVAADALTHALLRPRALWRVGSLARTATLTVELEDLRQRGVPVVVLWGREDTVVPWACAESLIAALGDPAVVTVSGDHAWLIADPLRFVEVITNVLAIGEDGQAA